MSTYGHTLDLTHSQHSDTFYHDMVDKNIGHRINQNQHEVVGPGDQSKDAVHFFQFCHLRDQSRDF